MSIGVPRPQLIQRSSFPKLQYQICCGTTTKGQGRVWQCKTRWQNQAWCAAPRKKACTSDGSWAQVRPSLLVFELFTRQKRGGAAMWHQSDTVGKTKFASLAGSRGARGDVEDGMQLSYPGKGQEESHNRASYGSNKQKEWEGEGLMNRKGCIHCQFLGSG